MAPHTQEIPQYYFAFGSNMHLTQMASRCPASRVFAKGILRGYRWQINQRGVANIVRCKRSEKQQHAVEGILFMVSSSDIRALDRSEGISKQFYDKALWWVDVAPLAIPELKGEPTALAAEKLKALQAQKPSLAHEGTDVEQVEALVYLSGLFRKDGLIRNEYVQRMELAMSDALKLGVSEKFLQESLYPFVFGDDSAMVSPDQPAQEEVDEKQGKECDSPDDNELGQGRKKESEPASETYRMRYYIESILLTDEQRKTRHHRRHSLPSRERPKASKGQNYQSVRTQSPRPQSRPDETTTNMFGLDITESGVAGMVGKAMDIGLSWLFGSGNEREPVRT